MSCSSLVLSSPPSASLFLCFPSFTLLLFTKWQWAMDNNTAATSDEKQPNWSGETTLSSACYGNRHDSCGAEAFTGSADAVAMPPPLSYQCTKTANCWVTTGPQLQWFSCLNTLTSTVLSELAATSFIFWKPLVWERDRGRKRERERELSRAVQNNLMETFCLS